MTDISIKITHNLYIYFFNACTKKLGAVFHTCKLVNVKNIKKLPEHVNQVTCLTNWPPVFLFYSDRFCTVSVQRSCVR